MFVRYDKISLRERSDNCAVTVDMAALVTNSLTWAAVELRRLKERRTQTELTAGFV